MRSRRGVSQVQSKTQYSYGGGKIDLVPVVSGSEENERFWRSTPNGSISMSLANPNLIDKFQPGAEYYIDFTPVLQPIDEEDVTKPLSPL